MFLSAAEVTRIAEDFGRFQLPLLLFKRPFLGWTHGSWLLINGAVENRIGWDIDNVCEDYWFGYHVSSLPPFAQKDHTDCTIRLHVSATSPNGCTVLSVSNRPAHSVICASNDDVGSREYFASRSLLLELL
jgi:hypothetical protein